MKTINLAANRLFYCSDNIIPGRMSRKALFPATTCLTLTLLAHISTDSHSLLTKTHLNLKFPAQFVKYRPIDRNLLLIAYAKENLYSPDQLCAMNLPQ